MQQYGFSTITVSGLTLDTSRVRRKPEAPKQETDDGGSTSIFLTPAAEANDLLKVPIADEKRFTRDSALAKELLD